MIINSNVMKKKKDRFEFHERFLIEIFLQLTSIFGCDNKISTISVDPFCEAYINGVKLKICILFHK